MVMNAIMVMIATIVVIMVMIAIAFLHSLYLNHHFYVACDLLLSSPNLNYSTYPLLNLQNLYLKKLISRMKQTKQQKLNSLLGFASIVMVTIVALLPVSW
jgi:hypothetical protein